MRVKESNCLNCGRTLDAATSVDGEETPEPDCITICLRCGHIMAFTADLSLRALTEEEIYEIAGEPMVLKAQRLRAMYLKRFGGD
jgi:hypothetical protein